MDYQKKYWLACEYFEQVNAPEKEIFVMKDATHGMLESRSEEYSEILHKIADLYLTKLPNGSNITSDR